MVKFVASVVAGMIATVLGGLILNHLTNLQGQQPHVTAPIPAPAVRDVDFSDLVPNRGAAASQDVPWAQTESPALPPGFVLDEPASSLPSPRLQTTRQQQGFLTYGEAEQGCDKGARIYKFEYGPSAGRYFCF
jgi:hypothetical protein